MNAATMVLIAVLAAAIAAAAFFSVRRMRKGGGCCGERGESVKRTGTADKNKSNYPYTATAEITGMMCGDCAKRVENALNGIDGIWAKVSIDTRRAVIRAKNAVDEIQIRAAVVKAGYGISGLEITSPKAAKKQKRLPKAAAIAAAAVIFIGGAVCFYMLHIGPLIGQNTIHGIFEEADPRFIKIDYGGYKKNSVPVGIHSVRFENKRENGTNSLHLCAKLRENAGQPAMVSVAIELLGEDEVSLGFVTIEREVEADMEITADARIDAERESNGYVCNGEIIRSARVVGITVN